MCEDSTCIFFIYFLILYNVNFAKRPKRGIYEEIPLFVKSHNGAPLCTVRVFGVGIKRPQNKIKLEVTRRFVLY